MRKLLSLFGFILVSQCAYAAKPIEVEIDRIFYRIDLDEMTASVYGAQDEIKTANIVSEIEYQSQIYSVTKISGAAFYRQWSLESVTIPNSIISIGGRAFESCRNLSHIEIPNSVKIIEASAFEMCRGLESIILPPSLSKVGVQAFRLCEKLTRVYITDLFSWCQIEFGYGGTSSPFNEHNANLFLNDELISDLVIPENLNTIKAWCFEGCGSITNVTIPNTVKTIGRYAFDNCKNLKTVNLGYGLEYMEWGAFGDCESLETINLYATNPPKLESGYGGYNQFSGSYPEYMTLHIPVGTKETYENSDGWKDFGTIIDDLPNDSGVEDVSIDESKFFEIFNLSGISVYFGKGDYYIPSGLYIIRQGSKNKRIIVK